MVSEHARFDNFACVFSSSLSKRCLSQISFENEKELPRRFLQSAHKPTQYSEDRDRFQRADGQYPNLRRDVYVEPLCTRNSRYLEALDDDIKDLPNTASATVAMKIRHSDHITVA